jgi:hypothetical protein
MKLSIPSAALAGFVALAVAGSAAAQSEPARTGATEAVTVTGCLRENAKRPGAYMLESIEGVGRDKSYRLIGSGTADLKAHVGHKIKATGTVAKTAPSAAPAPDATTGAGANEGPAMNVTSVAMVAESCAPPAR